MSKKRTVNKGNLTIEQRPLPQKCLSCGSIHFVYGDHASIQIIIRKDHVDYGEATYAGEVEYVRCAKCGKDLPKEIQDKINW